MRRLVLALLLAPAACLFPDLGGLGGEDASIDVADVVQSIDASDAAADVVPTPDAMPDAGSDAAFCASAGTHAFCEDFDVNAFDAQFSSVHQSLGATVDADSAMFKSPPRSLLSSLAAKSGNGDDAYMIRDFTATAKTATFAFDFRADSWTAGETGVFAGMIVDDGLPAHHSLVVYLTDTYSAIEESFTGDAGTVYKDHSFSTTVPLSKWTHLVLSLDLTARTCTASIDGVVVLPASPLDTSWKPGVPGFELGFSYVSSQTTAWQAHYDNVVFDFQ